MVSVQPVVCKPQHGSSDSSLLFVVSSMAEKPQVHLQELCAGMLGFIP